MIILCFTRCLYCVYIFYFVSLSLTSTCKEIITESKVYLNLLELAMVLKEISFACSCEYHSEHCSTEA